MFLSCRDFDESLVVNFSATWFEGIVAKQTIIRRL